MSDRTDAPGAHDGPQPWWASGRGPDEGLDDRDPFDAHRGARGLGDDDPADGSRGPGADRDERAAGGDPGAAGDGGGDPGGDTARLAGEAIDLIMRLAGEAGRRMSARSAGNAAGSPDGAFTRPDPPRDAASPHPDGAVCDACPVCIGLRAVRTARPEVIAHLSDAAHHVSLALRALADAQGGDDGLTRIDLDP